MTTSSHVFRLREWESERDDICEDIRRLHSVVKIVLKTKDDHYFLQEWIDHHSNIVGRQNIVIFDNGSTDPRVFAIYDSNPDVIKVFYRGFHNNIHNLEIFPELYGALRGSADWFAVLDTDERLITFDGERHWADQTLLEFLSANADVNAIPGVWMHNITGSSSIFTCGQSIDRLTHELAWGKPIIGANAPIKGFLNHNVQVNDEVWQGRVCRGLFVLHLADLHPEQRILSNMNKLVARKFVGDRAEVEVALSKEITEDMDPKIGDYVREIRRAVEAVRAGGYPVQPLRPGSVQLSEGGAVKYFSDVERDAVRAFLQAPDEQLLSALRSHA